MDHQQALGRATAQFSEGREDGNQGRFRRAAFILEGPVEGQAPGRGGAVQSHPMIDRATGPSGREAGAQPSCEEERRGGFQRHGAVGDPEPSGVVRPGAREQRWPDRFVRVAEAPGRRGLTRLAKEPSQPPLVDQAGDLCLHQVGGQPETLAQQSRQVRRIQPAGVQVPQRGSGRVQEMEPPLAGASEQPAPAETGGQYHGTMAPANNLARITAGAAVKPAFQAPIPPQRAATTTASS